MSPMSWVTLIPGFSSMRPGPAPATSHYVRSV